MPGVWKKTLNYLGLVEEDEDYVDEIPAAEPASARLERTPGTLARASRAAGREAPTGSAPGTSRRARPCSAAR